MENDLMKNFNAAKQAIYDHVGFKEDWTVYAIDDRTEMFWAVDFKGKSVRYASAPKQLSSPDQDYYEDEIYTQRFYSQWIYRGKDLTMIFVDTHTDGNKFFAFFDNTKEEL